MPSSPPICPLHPHQHEMSRLLAQPPVAYVPLPHVRPDLRQAPEEGSLGWLLAYGLSASELRCAPAVALQTASGVVEDAGLIQVWEHARYFYSDTGGPGAGEPCFAALPEPEPERTSSPDSTSASTSRSASPTPTPTLTDQSEAVAPLREHTVAQLNTALIQGCMHMLGLCEPGPASPPAVRDQEMRRVLVAQYILDRPIDSLFADVSVEDLRRAQQWSPLEVFGLKTEQVVDVLNKAGESGVRSLPIWIQPDAEMQQQMLGIANEFLVYLQGCTARVRQMRPDADLVNLQPDGDQAADAFVRQASSHSSSLTGGSGRDSR